MAKTFFKCLKCGQYHPLSARRIVNIVDDKRQLVENIQWCANCMAKTSPKQTSGQFDLRAMLNNGQATFKK